MPDKEVPAGATAMFCHGAGALEGLRDGGQELRHSNKAFSMISSTAGLHLNCRYGQQFMQWLLRSVAQCARRRYKMYCVRLSYSTQAATVVSKGSVVSHIGKKFHTISDDVCFVLESAGDVNQLSCKV
jgi:hypothetical protein